MASDTDNKDLSSMSPLSSDDEFDENDPFVHRIVMSPRRWFRTYLLTPILLPIRFFLLFVCLILHWIVARISLFGLTEEQIISQPLVGWRKVSKKVLIVLGKLGVRLAIGIRVKVKGRLASKEEAPILVVAPHSSYCDGFLMPWCDLPYVVSRSENRKLPFLGKIMEYNQSLFVCREDPQSRQNTVKQIVERSQDDNAWPQLLIFPEGSTSNRKALMFFKPGAFVPGKPVQPILIRYPNKVDTVTWTWDQPHGSKSILWLTLTQPFSRASIEFLDVYHPSPEEVQDPKLYASNVRNVMARALNVPTCDLTFEEVKKLYGKKYKQKKKED